jgi:hypothetical protein
MDRQPMTGATPFPAKMSQPGMKVKGNGEMLNAEC